MSSFLIEINGIKILADPYDQFYDVYMGIVGADYTIISSVAHDHGNIAASPHAWNHHEVGATTFKNGIIATGIMTKESRGTSNIIYNLKTDNISLTLFADLGNPNSIDNISSQEKAIIQTTDIAFVRPNWISSDKNTTSGELALQYCNPKIIIPYHFFPSNFMNKYKETKKMSPYLDWLEFMINKLGYQKHIIEGYSTEIDLDDYQDKTAILFSDIHPQVVYKKV